jgi:hypothetical protein
LLIRGPLFALLLIALTRVPARRLPWSFVVFEFRLGVVIAFNVFRSRGREDLRSVYFHHDIKGKLRPVALGGNIALVLAVEAQDAVAKAGGHVLLDPAALHARIVLRVDEIARAAPVGGKRFFVAVFISLNDELNDTIRNPVVIDFGIRISCWNALRARAMAAAPEQ